MAHLVDLVRHVKRAALGCVLLALLAAGCNEESTIRVRSLKFNGVKAVDASKLHAALATRQSSKLPWGKKAYFDRSRFEEDLMRIKAFYADRGYPDARVSDFDVKLNDKQDAVDVTVTIQEGDPIRVAEVRFVGFDVLPPDRLAAITEQAPLKVGAARDRELVVATHETALNELKDDGYPYASVAIDETATDGKRATVTFTATPGKLAHIASIQIQGNNSVSDHVILRQLTFKPGDLYRRRVLQESQRRLYRMELFEIANIEAMSVQDQPVEVPIRVTVAEGKHQRANFGVGYGTEEKARGEAEYHYLNFLGGARSAGGHVRWSSLDRGVRLDFNQPYFFAPHFSLGAEAQQWLTFTPAYNSTVTGAKLSVTHRRNRRTSWSVSMTSERDTSAIDDSVRNDPSLNDELIALGLDPRSGKQSGLLNAIGFDFQHSTADNPLNAHRGYQIFFHAEQAVRLSPGSFSYSSGSLDVRHYLPLAENLVVASRVQFGNIRPANNDPASVPFSKKFFLGGASSIRGWGRFEVSPLSPSGLPIGGNNFAAFSEELRALFSERLGAVLFFDGGNVWADSFGFRAADLRYAVGPGLRYQTPVGPLRFDVGWQINPIPSLLVNGQPQHRRWRMHFSIGQAF